MMGSGGNEPTQEEKDQLDRLHKEAESALRTQVIFEDEEERIREERLAPMRVSYHRMSQALPKKPGE